MRINVLLVLTIFLSTICYSQNRKLDSLSNLIAHATSDTQRINRSNQKLLSLGSYNLDTAIAFGNRIIGESKRINFKKGEAQARISLAMSYCFKGEFNAAKLYLDIANKMLDHTKDSFLLATMNNTYGTMSAMQNKFDESYKYYEKAAIIARKLNENKLLASVLQNTAIGYQQQSNFPKALEYFQKALEISEKVHDEPGAAYIYLNLGITYSSIDDIKRSEKSYLKALDLAQKYQLKNVESYGNANLASLYGEAKDYEKEYEYSMKAAILGEKMGDAGIQASSLARASLALAHQNKYSRAVMLNDQALRVADSSGQPYNIYQAYANRGTILSLQKEYRQAIPYLEKAIHQLTDADLYSAEVGEAYSQLANSYEKTGNYQKALSNFKIAAKITDSVRGRDNVKKATELTLNYEFDKKQQLAKVAQERKDAINDRTKTRQYFIIAVLVILILTAIIFTIIQIRNNKQKYKANLLLSRQKMKAENALTELKSAQAQLVQSEKMASLGELTAGIAHEIQNPLNFVNNFSEVNKELIDELKTELQTGNMQLVHEIAGAIKENSEKIYHHGKRAGDIVKGMLQHSRTSSGQKELTDINALCDEYLRLSYHGLRAKDKTFNANFKTDLDPAVSKINIVPQDIGRVILNLINNAFYAGAERSRSMRNETSESNFRFIPEVTLTTHRLKNSIEIKVNDNGNGIPKNIADKIFQPFFTTKPTGQGTGLGLSLSYDIIKAHGGDIKVKSQFAESEGQVGKEETGSEFIIILPVD